ncbi:MAG: 4-hydroxy-tetrahydrodipicolinate reductase [Verrucomicrobia bacterium]|nr:4-hydroxy-tetrahydrodipicolinate reductase [Verrucomicrobiota bacterium]
MTRVLINGCRGRMGQALIRCADGMDGLTVAAGVDVGDVLEDHLKDTDVVIDFSLHHATKSVVERCVAANVPIVIGTTGHDPQTRAHIESQSEKIPMVWASNFSTGVNTLFWLTQKAAGILGPEFDLEVIEMHHRHKQDAPSGTAATLVEILAKARGLDLESCQRHGRTGITGPRGHDEIGVHSLRGGDVVGDHTVVFATAGERVELTHKASSRDTFAMGALKAARWLHGQPCGLYNMQDVLGLKS